MEEGVRGLLFETLKKEFDLPEQDIRTYTPLTLAFVGDNVYDLVVRTILLCEGRRKLNEIHKQKSTLVKAATQAWIAEYLLSEGFFDEEEADYYRRGKNAKTETHAKNASYQTYHRATGLECVFGFLYLTGKEERAVELARIGIEAFMNKEKEGID